MRLFFSMILLYCSLWGTAQTHQEDYRKASAFFNNGDFQNALIHLNKALKVDSLNARYLLLKGETFIKLGKYQEAYDTYSLCILHHPRNVIGYVQRGVLLMNVKEPAYAIRDFSTALSFEKADSVIITLLLNRGAAKINIRDFKGAYDDFIAARKYDSLNIDILNNLAAVCDEIGKGDLTLGYLQQILTIDSTYVGAYINIGFKYQEMGDYQTAIRYFNKVTELKPDEPLAYSNRAYSWYKLGDYKKALSDINRSLDIYPGNSYAYRIRALIYLSLKNNKEACNDIATSLDQGFTKMYGPEMEQLKQKHCQ